MLQNSINRYEPIYLSRIDRLLTWVPKVGKYLDIVTFKAHCRSNHKEGLKQKSRLIKIMIITIRSRPLLDAMTGRGRRRTR